MSLENEGFAGFCVFPLPLLLSSGVVVLVVVSEQAVNTIGVAIAIAVSGAMLIISF